MQIAEIIKMSNEIEKVKEVTGSVEYVGDVQTKQGPKGPFRTQSLLISDGSDKIYWSTVVKGEPMGVDMKGKMVRISDVSINKWTGKDGKPKVGLKGGVLLDGPSAASFAPTQTMEEKKKEALRKALEAERMEKEPYNEPTKETVDTPKNDGARWGCSLHCASRVVAALINSDNEYIRQIPLHTVLIDLASRLYIAEPKEISDITTDPLISSYIDGAIDKKDEVPF